MSKIGEMLAKAPTKWYFLPGIGLVFLVLINLSIIAVAKGLPNTQITNSNKESLQNTPTPTPSPTATPQITSKPSPTPKPSVTPRPTITPKPTTNASPSPTATPIAQQDVRIKSPTHQQNYSGTEIEIEMEVITSKIVKKLEFIVNGNVRETLTSSPYKKTITLDNGKYELQGKAYLENDETISSGILKFGTGGVSWNAEPTP